MNLSSYYEEFQSTYKLAVFVVLFTFLAIAFVGVRLWKNKKENKKTKIGCSILLVLILLCVINYFIAGPRLAMKDVAEKTIYCYEGPFEITETSEFIYNKAVFEFEEKEITLEYFPEDDSQFKSIKPGKYEGKFIYAHYLGHLLYFEIYRDSAN